MNIPHNGFANNQQCWLRGRTSRDIDTMVSLGESPQAHKFCRWSTAARRSGMATSRKGSLFGCSIKRRWRWDHRKCRLPVIEGPSIPSRKVNLLLRGWEDRLPQCLTPPATIQGSTGHGVGLIRALGSHSPPSLQPRTEQCQRVWASIVQFSSRGCSGAGVTSESMSCSSSFI